MTVHRVKVCKCTHPVDWHDPKTGRCLYGNEHIFGGCTCVRFVKRGRGALLTASTPSPTPTASSSLAAAVEDAIRALEHLRAALVAAPSIVSVSRPPSTLPASTSSEPVTVSGGGRLKRRPIASTSTGGPFSLTSFSTAKLSTGERRVLIALAQHPEGLTKSQIAILSGYKFRGSTLRNILSSLRTSDLLGGDDRIVITEHGRKSLGEFERLPTGDAIVSYWKRRCGKCPSSVLDAIVAAHPQCVARHELPAMTGYNEGSTLRNAVAKLRQLELIVGRSELTLTDAFASAAISPGRSS